MEKYLNTGIKEIIDQFPETESILEEYGIGCAPCNVGTCLLKDIVEIHNLSPHDEQALLTRIAGIIYPGIEITIQLKKRTVKESGEIKYSPPMKKLVDEHVLIKRLVAMIPAVIEVVDIEFDENYDKSRQMVLDLVDFIRFYADKYHHAKEEEILFKYFDETVDIIQVMLTDHENARSHVRSILAALDGKDKEAVIEHLKGYSGILPDHIKREDEILYPWMDRNLKTHEVGELYSKFNDVDRQLESTSEKYEIFVNQLENKLTKLKEGVK